MWEVKIYLAGNKEDPFVTFDSRSEAEKFRDVVANIMMNKGLVTFDRDGRNFTVDGAHVAMVEMYQAYRGEKIW